MYEDREICNYWIWNHVHCNQLLHSPHLTTVKEASVLKRSKHGDSRGGFNGAGAPRQGHAGDFPVFPWHPVTSSPRLGLALHSWGFLARCCSALLRRVSSTFSVSLFLYVERENKVVLLWHPLPQERLLLPRQSLLPEGSLAWAVASSSLESW